jgi:hypothetical protein
MFLNEKQKGLKTKALDGLMSDLDVFDKKKLGGKPVVAEMSVTKVEPIDKLGAAMKAAGHEGVEEKEEELFPAEEAKEEALMGGEEPGETEEVPGMEKEGEDVVGGISEEEKQMIEELYNRFVR